MERIHPAWRCEKCGMASKLSCTCTCRSRMERWGPVLRLVVAIASKMQKGKRTPSHEKKQTHFVRHESYLANKSTLRMRRKNAWNARLSEGGKVAQLIERFALLPVALSRDLSCQSYRLRTRNTPSFAKLLRGPRLYSGNWLETWLHPQTTSDVRPSLHGTQTLPPKNRLASATCGHIHLATS